MKGHLSMKSARCLRTLVVVSGFSVAVPLLFAGPASADPVTEALANTSCNYAQVTAALNAEAPALARQLNARPDMQANIQQFLAMPIDQRQQQLAQQQAVNPALQAMIYAQIGP